MLGAPDANRKIVERDAEKNENAEDGGRGGAALEIVDKRAQDQIGDVQNPENQRQRQAPVPCPPNAPDGMRPDRSGDEDDGPKCETDFDGGDGEPVPFGLALPEIGDVREKDDACAFHCCPTGGSVEIKNALDGVHGGFVGRDEKDGVAREKEQGGKDESCDSATFHEFAMFVFASLRLLLQQII